LVDEQHKTLVKLINDLYFSIDQKGTDVPSALAFLLEYTVSHFDAEEKLQLASGFPEYKRHKKMHKELKATVRKLADKYIKHGSAPELKSDLSKVLAAWLIRHIEYEDKKIGEHIAAAQKK